MKRGGLSLARRTTIEDRRATMLEMMAMRYSTRQIAAKLGLSMVQVQREAKIVRQRRIAEAIYLDDQLAQRSIAMYELIQQRAYEGYLRSLEDDVTIEEALTEGRGGRKRMEIVKRMSRGQSGANPFLQTMINAQAKIDEINGLIGKDRFEASSEHQTPNFLRVVVESREQVDEYGSLKLQQAKALGIIEGVATPSAGP